MSKPTFVINSWLTISLLALFLPLCACSFMDTTSEPATPLPDKNDTLTFKETDSLAQRIRFTDPAIFQSDLYGLKLEDCSQSEEVGAETPSLSGKARQLLIGFDSLKILKRNTLEAEVPVVSLHATAILEDSPIALVAYTWTSPECLHDFMVWSKDLNLVTSQETSEHLALAILDRYVLTTVQSFSF